MPRLRARLLRLTLLFAVVPASALAQVQMVRPPAPIPVRQFGQLTSDPGIECIASDPALVLGLGVYSVVTGTRLATFPDPFNATQTTFTLRDFDANGLDEALAIYFSGFGISTTVGLIRHSKSTMTRVFPDLELPGESSLAFIETMHLNVSETRAFVFAGRGVHIVSQSGALLYTSATDPAYPLGSGAPTVTIDDFDGDGFEEVAATFTSNPMAPSLVLIGDATPTVGVEESRVVARPMLLATRPNPSIGPARIAFELPHAAQVRLRIYDAAGRVVNQLADGPLAGGRHDVVWTGLDATGRRVPGGVYFSELEVDGVRESRRMVQLR